MDTKKSDHAKAILEIINEHFDQADKRVDDVYKTYFTNTGAVLSRHWRNKKDIPSDLMTLPRHTWNFFSTKVLRKQTKALPKSGKMKEIEVIMAENLLDLKGLEKKIENYVTPYQLKFETEFTDILEQVPALQQKKFTKELEAHLESLNTPIEGAREAVVFLIAGIVGKVFSDKVTFGSSLATGKAVAASVYLSQLSWFGSLWANIFGVPTWVSVAGAGAGILAAVIIAPMFTPIFELGINKLRARKILVRTIESARQKLTQKGADKYDIAGRTAIYLQVLPDLLELTRKTAKVFL